MSVEVLVPKSATDDRSLKEDFIKASDLTAEFFAKLFDRADNLAHLQNGKHDAMRNGFLAPSETSSDEREQADDLSVNQNHPKKPGKRFRIIQKWEGTVIEVTNDTIVVELKTISGEEGDLIAEIFMEEVDRDDRTLVIPGAVFYWNIGYLQQPSGTMRISLIRFRRLPPWNKRQLQKAKIETAKLKALLDVN